MNHSFGDVYLVDEHSVGGVYGVYDEGNVKIERRKAKQKAPMAENAFTLRKMYYILPKHGIFGLLEYF